MLRKLIYIITLFVIQPALFGQEVKIPESFALRKHMQTLTPYESQWFNFSLSYTNVNHYKINIPITSIDITGSLDIADTLIYYIKRASDSLNGPYTATVQLPKGTFLLLKEIIIPSGIHVKGEGAGVTIINCKAGEGKHCFKLSPQNTNAIAKLPISQSLEKGQDSFLVDIDTLDSVSESFFGAIVNYNDSDLVTSSWSKSMVKEHFTFMNENGNFTQRGSNYIIPLNIDGFFGESLQYKTKKTAIAYPKSTSGIEVYQVVHNAGLLCLSINRLDTTSSQTSNIKLKNAYSCLVKGVQSTNCNFGHITLENSAFNIIKRNVISYGNGYGGGGKAYGIVLQQGSSSNTIADNELFHLRHSILLQSGANNNVIVANYSYDPYWEGTAFPADAAGDLVLHGNYPFGNLFEANIAQQIVIDNTHGKNGPNNIFHRNWLQNYGITMSAANGSHQQVFTGNEVTNMDFLKGLYILQDTGHFIYGNKVRGNVQPGNSTKTLTKSVVSLNYTGFASYRRTAFYSPSSFYNTFYPPFGEPFNQSNKYITAHERKGQLPLCYDPTLDYDFGDSKVESLYKEQSYLYPNPSNGIIKSSQSGSLEIFDLNGRLLLSQSVLANQEILINLKGLFLAKLKTEQHYLIQKLILQ